MPGIVLDTGNPAVNNRDSSPCPRGADIPVGKTDRKQDKQVKYAECQMEGKKKKKQERRKEGEVACHLEKMARKDPSEEETLE